MKSERDRYFLERALEDAEQALIENTIQLGQLFLTKYTI